MLNLLILIAFVLFIYLTLAVLVIAVGILIIMLLKDVQHEKEDRIKIAWFRLRFPAGRQTVVQICNHADHSADTNRCPLEPS